MKKNPGQRNRPYRLTASLICANMLKLAEEIATLEEGGVDYLHFDVMDGLFVPRYGLHPEILTAVRSVTNLPVDVHLMVENPDPYIPVFAKEGADMIAVHAESTRHLHRSLMLIKEHGAKAGVALNPATPVESLQYVLDDLDWVMLMAINPGIVGHKLIPGAIDKIKKMKEMVADRDGFIIQIDGGVTFESAPRMLEAGANMLVCGSSTIFKPDQKSSHKLKELRQTLTDIQAPELVFI